MSKNITSTLRKLGTFAVFTALFVMGGTVQAQNAANGKTLYNQVVSGLSCSNSACHNPDPTGGKNKIKNGANAPTVIQAAINANTGGMGIYKNVAAFNLAGLTDIAAYIANPAAANGTPTSTPSPTSLSFPATLVGATSATSSFTISNTGTAALSISAVTLTGTNTGDFVIAATSTCKAAASVAATTGTCTVDVQFKPAAAGARAANVVLTHNATTAGATTTTVALSGSATGVPAASLTLTSMAFGSIIQGTSSTAQTATLTNSGSANLVLSGLSLTGTNASEFSLGSASGSCTATTSLAPAGSCSIAATFNPTTTGSKTASVSITHNATGSPTTIALTGTGGAANPAITATPTSLSFGSTAVGSSATTQQISLKNSGQAAMTFSSFAWSGTNTTDFSQTNTCPVSPATLAVNATCTVTVGYTPTAVGTRTATMTVNSDASNSPALAIATSGTAVATAVPSITSTPTSAAFSATTINTSATTQAIAIKNNGQAALTISSISLGGANANEFTQTSACVGSLAVNATCNVTVGFSPMSVGAKAATLVVASNASNAASYSVGLSGSAVAAPVPSITSNVTSLTFPSTTMGVAAATQTVTITNNATPNAAGASASLNITGLSFTGANPGDFSQTNNCPASLAPAASCVVTVGFKPSAVAARAANLAIASNASNAASYVVSLSGTGTAVPAPAMTLDVTTMTFGNQLQNTTSATQTVTITNTGNANLTGVNAVSSNTAFKVANNGCSAAIAPNGTCMIDVTFTPTATGALTANLTVSGTGVTDGTVAMTGTGTASSVTGADALNGQKLFLANCASCHTSNPAANISRVTLGVSAQVSKNAINANMGGMGSLTSLSTQDLNDIAAYIGAQTNQKPTLMSSTPAATGGTSTNVGGGGCTIGTTDSPFDPLLVLMAAISAVVLVRRQSKR